MPELPAYACFVAGSPIFDVIEGNEQSIRMCFVYENAADAGCKDVRPVVVTWGGAADAEPEMAEPFPNRTWPWRMEDCDQEATAERHRRCYVYPDRAFQEIERLRASVRWHRSVLSRTEISAAIAADATMPEEPPVG